MMRRALFWDITPTVSPEFVRIHAPNSLEISLTNMGGVTCSGSGHGGGGGGNSVGREVFF